MFKATQNNSCSARLRQKTISGGAWVFFTRGANIFLQLCRTVILARILSPHDFGLFSVALLSLFLLRKCTNIGFVPALIQRNDDIAPYLDTAWTAGVVRGVLVILLLLPIDRVIAAPPEGYRFLSLTEAMQLASRENKPMLLYFGRYGCTTCRKMHAEVFTDASLSAKYNTVIVIQISMVSKVLVINSVP